MCFSKPKSPDIKPAPTPDPTPIAVQTTESGVSSIEERRKKLKDMRMGLSSTIKTSPIGTPGQSLAAPSLIGKTKLGQ